MALSARRTGPPPQKGSDTGVRMEHCLDRYRSAGQILVGMCECATVRGPASQCFASEQLAWKRV